MCETQTYSEPIPAKTQIGRLAVNVLSSARCIVIMRPGFSVSENVKCFSYNGLDNMRDKYEEAFASTSDTVHFLGRRSYLGRPFRV